MSAPTQGAPGSPGRDAASLLPSADLGAEIRIYGRGAWAPPPLTTSPLPPPPHPRGAGRQSALGAAGRTPLEQSLGTPSNPQTQLCAPHYPFHLPAATITLLLMKRQGALRNSRPAGPRWRRLPRVVHPGRNGCHLTLGPGVDRGGRGVAGLGLPPGAR